MANKVVNVTHIPEVPTAGAPFVVVVELSNAVSPDAPAVTVKFEKQRLVADLGGFAVTRPTGGKYFLEDPQPIEITSGKFGISKPIVVDPKATAPTGDAPISFPEKLLISAFIGQFQDGFHSELIYVAGPAEIPPGRNV